MSASSSDEQALVTSTWVHATEFVKTLSGPSFFQLKSPTPFWGANVVQMQTPDIHEIFEDKMVTLKVDGERHILILFVERAKTVRGCVMTRSGRLMDVALADFCALRPSSKLTPGFFTVLDCEYIANGAHPLWLVFDCLVFRAIGGTRTAVTRDFVERVELVHKALTEDFASTYLVAKPFFPVVAGTPLLSEWVARETSAKLGRSLPHDGLVFQPRKGVYPVGANLNLPTGRGLKWKPECTLDLVPERVKFADIVSLHKKLYGAQQFTAVPWDHLIRPMAFYGLTQYVPRLMTMQLTGRASTSFRVPPELCRLKCVSDFSHGPNVLMNVVECDGVPLCVDLPAEAQTGVHEFSFGAGLVPVYRSQRADKATHQANKARTVAGVLWQAQNDANLDRLVENPALLPPRLVVPLPETLALVSTPEQPLRTPFPQFVRTLAFDDAIENEFKIIQTKRPRAGVIFPAALEPSYTNAPFVDALHFQRAMDGLMRKYNKTEPPLVNSIDLIVDDNLRLTAMERTVQTRSGHTLHFYETLGFQATRKKAAGESYIVHLPDVERTSGYVYRLDTRSEVGELFYRHEYLPDNPEYNDFLRMLVEQSKSTKKRKAEFEAKFKGYRFVDKMEFEPELERNVELARVRRLSMEPTPTVGERVQCSYRTTGQLHPGILARIHPNGTVDVKYDYSVRTSTSYATSDHIPLLVDALPATTLVRVKRRRTFEFPGFRVDFTRTKNVHGFVATETRRLHHLPHRCDNYEIEVEMLSSITRNPEYLQTLREVMRDLLACMNLDENAFLFDKAGLPRATVAPALQRTLDDYSAHIRFDSSLQGVHAAFTTALRGASRIVRESDFFHTLDDAADALLGPIVPLEDMANADGIHTPEQMARLSPWVDRSARAVEDYNARRVFHSVCAGSNAHVTRSAGADLFGFNGCWADADATFEWLCKRLSARALLEIEEEDFVMDLRMRLFGFLDPDIAPENPFFHAPFAFGKAVAQALVLATSRAWWDEHEVALVWNDILDLALRFANAVYSTCPRDVLTKLWDDADGDTTHYHVHRDVLKLAVVTGAILACRKASTLASSDAPAQQTPCIASDALCARDYARYAPRTSSVGNDVDIKSLAGVPVVYFLF